jgi:hypothetical protein
MEVMDIKAQECELNKNDIEIFYNKAKKYFLYRIQCQI